MTAIVQWIVRFQNLIPTRQTEGQFLRERNGLLVGHAARLTEGEHDHAKR